MREAHTHLASLGQSLAMPSLESCRGLADCLDRVRAAAAAAAPGAFIRLHSARPEGWPEARWPSINDLDGASPDNPALMSFDHHAATANTVAAAAAMPGSASSPTHAVVVDAAN